MPIDHQYDHSGKVYVDVVACFHTQGIKVGRDALMLIEPLSFVWEDGNKFHVSKVLDMRRAASMKAGGTGLRYTVKVGNKETYIWLEGEDRWFMERKTPQ